MSKIDHDESICIEATDLDRGVVLICLAIERERRARGMTVEHLSMISRVSVEIIDNIEQSCNVEYFEHLAMLTSALGIRPKSIDRLGEYEV